MGTRSNIIVKYSDGKYHRIYCHWDGYPSNNGKILKENYNSQKRAEKVVSLGDLSALNESMECPEGHDFENPIDNYSIVYGRDRGEKNVSSIIKDNLKEIIDNIDEVMIEYIYLWDGEKWIYKNTYEQHTEYKKEDEDENGFVELTDEIISGKE